MSQPTAPPLPETPTPTLPRWKTLWQKLCAKPRRPRLFTLLGLALGPLVTLYATQVVWLQSLLAPFPWMAAHLPAVGLFWLLFAGISTGLYGIFRRLFPAFIPQVGLYMGVAVSSRYKFDIMGAPLQLSDFSFVGNLGEVTGFAARQLIPPLMTLVGIAAAAVLTETLRRKETWRLGWKPGLGLLLAGAAVCLSALFPGPLQSAALALDKNCIDQTERCESAGAVLSIYTAWVQRQAGERGQSDSYYLGLAQRFRDESRAKGTALPLEAAPDIVFVTSESFFDITRLPNLSFAEDPLPTFHALAASGTDGLFVSNNHGGGTGNVEMEMFTGISKEFLLEGDSMTGLDTAFYQDVPATVRSLKKAGYQTVSVHSYTDRLYERRRNYPAIGFDTVVFQEDFITEREIGGVYTSDVSFARELIARYEARDPEKPCFLYGMSMENHQGYAPAKYDTPSGYPAQSGVLSGEELETVDVLVHGLHGADTSLGVLVDYFSQAERPVLLVFVGDHLPTVALGDGASLYTHLGYTPTDSSSDWDAETLKNILSTNYVIWSNYEEKIPADRVESSLVFGIHVLERAGIPQNSYFTWLSENITPQLLQVRGRLFVDRAGTAAYETTAEQQKARERLGALEKALIYDTVEFVGDGELEE